MFELPEYTNFVEQMNQTIRGKTVSSGEQGNSPHKFVWYNRSHEEFAALTVGKKVGEARSRGRWLFITLEPGYVLVFGECGGKLLYHAPGEELPEKYHLLIRFTDGSALSAFTQMWGAMELYEHGAELERQYIKDMRVTPADAAFTFSYFNNLIDDLLQGPKRSAKSLLTQDQLIPGLGNAIAQDIIFRARLDPRRPLADVSEGQLDGLFAAITGVVHDVIAAGGRSDERDLFGRSGGYARLMDAKAAGRPCPECGTPVTKISYLGGACYFCPACQR